MAPKHKKESGEFMSKHADTAPLSFKEKLGYGLGDMASNFYLGFFNYNFCVKFYLLKVF